MLVRHAEDADIAALESLVNRAYRGETAKLGWTHEADLLSGQRVDRDILRAMLHDARQHLLVAEAPDGIVACADLVEEGDFGYLGLLTVDPRRQGQGLGKAMTAAAEALARELGLTRIKMTVIVHRGELIAWYERLGYERTGAREAFPVDEPRFGTPLRDDLEFVVMEKALPPLVRSCDVTPSGTFHLKLVGSDRAWQIRIADQRHDAE